MVYVMDFLDLELLNKVETVEDFKKFLNRHHSDLIKNTVSVDELPSDDDWIKDNIWDKIYEQGKVKE